MKKAEEKTTMDLLASSRINVFFQSAFITLATIGVFGGGGYALDKYLGTFPTLFIIGLVISYPLTQIYLFRKFKSYAKDKLKEIKK